MTGCFCVSLFALVEFVKAADLRVIAALGDSLTVGVCVLSSASVGTIFIAQHV